MKKKIFIEVSTSDGWRRFTCEVPESVVEECYALPGSASRADFWSAHTAEQIPNGALVWMEAA